MMENPENRQLHLAQRYWWLLCLVVAVIGIVIGMQLTKNRNSIQTRDYRNSAAGSGSAVTSDSGSAPGMLPDSLRH